MGSDMGHLTYSFLVFLSINFFKVTNILQSLFPFKAHYIWLVFPSTLAHHCRPLQHVITFPCQTPLTVLLVRIPKVA